MRATLVRNSNDGLLYVLKEDKTSFLADISQGNVLKLRENITNLDNDTEFELKYFPTNDGTITFLLAAQGKNPNTNFPFAGTGNSGAGSGGGRTGVYVQDEGVQVNGIFKTLNFIGSSVIVTDAGAGVANITITGGSTGWQLDGNTVGAEKWIGTIDNFNFPIRTNNIVRGVIDNGGLWAIGSSTTTAGARLYVKGTAATVATKAFRVDNSTPTEIFSIYNSGQHILAGDTTTGNLFLGYSSGLLNTYIAATQGDNNTALGVNALFSSTGSRGCVAVGYQALYSNTCGAGNTAIGYQSLYSLSFCGAGHADGNTAIGYQSQYTGTQQLTCTSVGQGSLFKTTGDNNCAFGYNSLYNNSAGADNTALGTISLYSNTTGIDNVAVGNECMYNNVNGHYNAALGWRSLYANVSGTHNVAMGYASLENNTNDSNTGIGFASMLTNTSGSENTAVGESSLRINASGVRNCAFGVNALYSENNSYNNAFGYNAMQSASGSSKNCAFGYGALQNVGDQENTAMGHLAGYVTTAGYNTFIGSQSGFSNITGNANVFLGYKAGYYSTSSNAFYVNNQDRTNTAGDKSLSLLYGTFAATTASQFLRVNANFGINTNTFGTSADGVFAMLNGTAPSTFPANTIQAFATGGVWKYYDSAGNLITI